MIDLSQLRIALWRIDRILAYARNSRTHSDEQVAQVAASIVEFGWTSPILVDGEGVIIAGHARLLAARKLGMDEVPVIVLAHLTPAQRRALVIADNQIAMNAGWNAELLRCELESLGAEGFNLSVVGFSDEELRALLRARAVSETYKAKIAQMEYEERAGKLIQATKAGEYAAHWSAIVGDALAAFADRVAPLVAAAKTEAEIHRILASETNALRRKTAKAISDAGY